MITYKFLLPYSSWKIAVDGTTKIIGVTVKYNGIAN